MLTCVLTPYNIAFDDGDTSSRDILDHVIDILFFIDIIVFFNTEYINENYEVVRNRKEIACHYLKGWFTIDVISIIPFDEILTRKYNKLSRFARVGRLQKLIKLGRLFRLLKLAKNTDTLISNFSRLGLIGPGMLRLIVFLFSFMFMTHICTCFWIIIATFT